MRLGGGLVGFQTVAISRTGLSETVVLQVPGMSLREAHGLRRNDDGRLPEVLLPVVTEDPLEAILSLPHVRDGLAGGLRLAKQEVNPNALDLVPV